MKIGDRIEILQSCGGEAGMWNEGDVHIATKANCDLLEGLVRAGFARIKDKNENTDLQPDDPETISGSGRKASKPKRD